MRTEVTLMAKVLGEAWDLFTDGWFLVHSVLNNEEEAIRQLVPSWVTAFSLAALVSTISLATKLRLLVEQFRARRTEIELDYEDSSGLKKHNDRLLKTQRSIQLIYVAVLVGVVEV